MKWTSNCLSRTDAADKNIVNFKRTKYLNKNIVKVRAIQCLEKTFNKRKVTPIKSNMQHANKLT